MPWPWPCGMTAWAVSKDYYPCTGKHHTARKHFNCEPFQTKPRPRTPCRQCPAVSGKGRARVRQESGKVRGWSGTAGNFPSETLFSHVMPLPHVFHDTPSTLRTLTLPTPTSKPSDCAKLRTAPHTHIHIHISIHIHIHSTSTHPNPVPQFHQ